MTQTLIKNISSTDIKNLVRKYSANKIFLVTGKSSFIDSGSNRFIEEGLNGEEYVRFSDFQQNPKYEDVLRGLEIFRQSKSNLIIAIGGGSVIDMAKLINIFSANDQINSLQIVNDSKLISKKGEPLIAIPTTAGTGSEATHFAVIYHDNKKYSVAHQFILPDAVGLNTMFSVTQPSYLTACTGLDALSQAIESYWSVGANAESKAYAKEAIHLLLEDLPNVTKDPTNEKSRETVMLGSYLAGKAINISKTTAAHAVSYAFTTYYSIPHGHAVFLTLPEFFEFNFGVTITNANDPRGVEFIKNNINDLCSLFKINNPNEGKFFLKEFARKLGIEVSIAKLGITDYEDIIVNNVNTERLGNNPRKISEDELRKLLKNQSN
ncbi:alcohol dehydrogenase [Arenibacter sp. N53]|nr:alcohol dehydrogenase [Arenibacter sp. N53]